MALYLNIWFQKLAQTFSHAPFGLVSFVEIGWGWASVGFEAFLPNAAQPQSLNRFTMSLMLTCSLGCGVYSLNFGLWLKSLLQPSCWWMNTGQYFQKTLFSRLGDSQGHSFKNRASMCKKRHQHAAFYWKIFKIACFVQLELVEALKLRPPAWSKFVKSTWLG